MGTEKEMKMKVCLLGDPAVGKTSLIRRFVVDKFDDKYISTLGTKVTKKTMTIDAGDAKVNMTLMIWDVLGQSDFKNVLMSAFQGAKGAMIICDITRRETLNNLKGWIERLFSTTGPLPIVILANKCDLKGQAQFNSEDLESVARRYKAPHFLTSAKTGEHVNEAFYGIAKEMAMVSMGLKRIEAAEATAGEGRGEEITVKSDVSINSIRTLVDVEDYIIYKFCEAMGGQDFAMPIIRQQFKRADMDFRKPDISKIKVISKNLVGIVKDFKSPDDADRLKKEFQKAILKYEGK